jgi:hypothetical protein
MPDVNATLAKTMAPKTNESLPMGVTSLFVQGPTITAANLA